MNNRFIILGNTLLFARAGADDGEDVVGPTHKPTPTAEVFLDAGTCDALTPKITEEVINLKQPRGGRYGKGRSINVSQELGYTAKMQDANELTFEALYRLAGAITINTAQAPMRQTNPITGWLTINQHDQKGVLTTQSQLYVELRVNSKEAAEKKYDHEMEISVIDNDLNTFNLKALEAN